MSNFDIGYVTSFIPNGGAGINDIQVYSDYLFITSGNKLISYDISDPSNPVVADEISTDLSGGAGSLTINGSNIYVVSSDYGGSGQDGIIKFSISDPTNIIHSLSVNTGFYINAIHSYGSYIAALRTLDNLVSSYSASGLSLISSESISSSNQIQGFRYALMITGDGNTNISSMRGEGSGGSVVYGTTGITPSSLSYGYMADVSESLSYYDTLIIANPGNDEIVAAKMGDSYWDNPPFPGNYDGTWYSIGTEVSSNIQDCFSLHADSSDRLYVICSTGYHVLLQLSAPFSATFLAEGIMGTPSVAPVGNPSKYGNYYFTPYDDKSVVVTETGELFSSSSSSSSSEQYSSSSSEQYSSSSSSSEGYTSSSSSGDNPITGITYYSDFKDMNSINNAIINEARIQYRGFFDVAWDKDTLDIEDFGYGLRKTRNNQGMILCDDASKLFSMESGAVKIILSLPYDIVNGVYKPLINDNSDLNEYILWGVNIGRYETGQPGLYAALTPRGIEFTIKTSKGNHTITDNISNITADTSVSYEFIWDSVNIDGYMVKTLLRIDGVNMAAGNPPIANDDISGLNFCALNTPFGYNNMECVIRGLVIYNEIPYDIKEELWSSSSSSSSS